MHEINQLRSVKWQLRGAATIILSVSLLAPALAQQAPGSIRLSPEDEGRGLGGPQHNFDFLAPGASGDNYQTAGFFGQKLRPYLAGNADALAHLDEYRRQKTFFLIDRLVAVGSFGVYGQQILAHGDRVYFNSTQQVAIGVFATSLIATIFINRNTNSHLQRAVKSFNQDVAHGGTWQRLQPAAIGFAAAPTGQPLLSLRWALR
ncbi:hypothetical protein KB206_17065 [Microvirga sp. STS02]|uniref:hypothetical protein n=1 Tax=Hymenobacter negativus TaxID=2795026 RepID=UPI0018DB9069|nr:MULTISPECIES: hypothetical protein [Bacteria]MBH8570606.1 hypothetical protein [Hymenobacter negativus]MBR7210344.1 hypothetical protein [Microvirga sp. STS02]